MKILLKIKNAIKALFSRPHVTNSAPTSDFSQTRDISCRQSRDLKSLQNPDFQPTSEKTIACPYCQGKNIVKKGTRKKKLETVQLYCCSDCKKVFTPQKVKGKQFPLNVILDGLSFYNTGFTLEESCGFLKEKFGFDIRPSTLSPGEAGPDSTGFQTSEI